MQFHFRTVLLILVILYSAMVALGVFEGVVAALIIAATAVGIRKQPGLTIAEWSVCIIIALVLVGLLLPAVSTGLKPEDYRRICTSRLQQLAKALLAYHDQHGSYPPAYAADKAGKPMCSWRAQLLPFLDENDLYQQYDANSAWNSPKNSTVSFDRYASRRFGNDFQCWIDPSSYRGPATNDTTSYFAVVGPRTAWHGSAPTRRSDLPDGGRRMILLVESADRAINWKEPKDLTYEEAVSGVNRPSGPCISSAHAIGDDYFHTARHGAFVAFVDGSVHFLPEDISAEDLDALLTGDTARAIDLEALTRPSLDWTHIVALAVLIPSSGLLVIGALTQRLRRKPEQEDGTSATVQTEANEQQ
jgi:hypothetical protein